MTAYKAPCPCQSGLDYSACCSPFHHQASGPDSAEKLMRSRYSAFCLGEVDYLLDTLPPSKRQPDEREALLESIKETRWLGLKVLNHKPSGDRAVVEFVAFYEDAPFSQLHERSRFTREAGRWYYHDGLFLPAIKLGRNEPCFCGSGKKLKHCHA